MEEKRKLEKLLLTDIDSALTIYTAQRKPMRDDVAEKALKNAPSSVVALLNLHRKSQQEVKRTEAELSKLGYSLRGYDLERTLAIGYSIVPKPVQAFDDKTEKAKSALTTMKRTYTLKLFAGGEEAQELFASLAHELAAIVN